MSILDDIVGAAASPGGSVLKILLGPLFERIVNLIPDPQKKAEVQLELARLAQADEFKKIDADLQIALAQAQINLEEAKSTEWFKSYARPAAMWVCVLGLVGQFMVAPTLTWLGAMIGHPVPFPKLDNDMLLTLTVTLLGLGTLRTVDKVKGVP